MVRVRLMRIYYYLMIPFQKIFTLVIRTFSKPMLSLMKKKQQQGKFQSFRWFFVTLGRRYQVFEHWLNHRLLKTAHKKQLTELKEQILLEKGVQAFYELFFYSIVIGLPMYELYKGAESAEKKEKKMNEKIDSMERKLQAANEGLGALVKHLEGNAEREAGLKGERERAMQEYAARRMQRFKGEIVVQSKGQTQAVQPSQSEQ